MSELVPMSAAPAVAQLGGGSTLRAAHLSRRAKAAIIVRLLINDGADIPLENLPEELQAHLTTAMGSMHAIDHDTLNAVVAEFTEEVERVGLSFPGGMAGALSALDGRISPQTAARLRKESGVHDSGDPWIRIRAMSVDLLTPLLETESIEIGAVLISKLEVPKAAQILGRLPGPRARRITYAMSKTEAVTPDAVLRIGKSLAAQLESRPLRAFHDGPVERVSAILNSSSSLTRDDVLAGLDETDESFATAVRKTLFTFANIETRVAPRDIPRVLRNVDNKDLKTALGGAAEMNMEGSANFILDNMSSRLADQLRQDIRDVDTPSIAETDAAMGMIVAAIRTMEAAGDLSLLSPK